MLDVDTFLTALYVMVDDLRQSHRTERGRPGPDASLCCSEVITLSIFARWSRFTSERDFYRYAEAHLRAAFPTLSQTVPNSTVSCDSMPRRSRRSP
jgi:hypothetical protein